MEGMKGRARMLALAIAAVLALGAVGAQGAMADPLFTSADEHTIFKATTGAYVTQIGGQTVACTALHTEATTSKKGWQVTSFNLKDPTGCTAIGFATAHMAGAACALELESTGEVELNCGTGEQLRVTPTVFGFSVCTIYINSGKFEGVSYDNISAGDVEATVELSGISYEETSGSCGVESGNDGTLSTTFTIAGTDTDEEPVDIEVG